MKIICPNCKQEADKPTGSVNRALKINAPLYCSKKCAGLGRRVKRTKDEKILLKRLYDIEYRNKNSLQIKAKKKAYEQTEAGRQMQKRNRIQMKDRHLEYCRTEEYKQWKKQYDKIHVAKKNYGEFWESSAILMDLGKLISPDKYEIRKQNKTLNKNQNRRRLWNSMQKTLK